MSCRNTGSVCVIPATIYTDVVAVCEVSPLPASQLCSTQKLPVVVWKFVGVPGSALAIIKGLKTERTIERDIKILTYFNNMFC
ncbi:MAG: hypothetical protein R2741_12675 [Methanolobus sp.]